MVERMVLARKLVAIARLSVLTVSLCFSAAPLAVSGAQPGRDRLITFEMATEMAERARMAGEVPIIVNDQVLRLMNQMLATRAGRATMRRALEAMAPYRARFEQIFREHRLPTELLAIPIVESGYRNLPESASPGKSAGLWQFLKSTARNYGLRVGEKVDERLDVERATRAAARYLVSLEARFADWHLALAAYNRGEGMIEKLIAQNNGSRDPWQFARERKIPDYLARVMVAMIALKDPSILN